MGNLKFDWKYALDKLLIFLTSTKNIAIVSGYLVAVLGVGIPEQWQGVAALFAGAIMAGLKAYEDGKR